jgi:hypothetical protein
MPCESAQNSKNYSCDEWNKINRDFFLQEPQINLKNITKDNLMDKIELKKLKEQNKFLEACLCAILTELEKQKIDKKIIDMASANGVVNILSFWEIHKQKDIDRLQKELDKFSEHEKQILKTILCK